MKNHYSEEEKLCEECLKQGIYSLGEDHHIVYKSECKPLDKCPFNHVYLCNVHHRDHKYGVHFNKKLNKYYKSQVKAKLQVLFTEDYYSMEQIRSKLHISNNATRSLCKLMLPKNCKYAREDIIRTCVGGNYRWEDI